MNFNFLSSCLIVSSLIAVPSIAQMNNPDDLPNDSSQMRTWYCNQGNQEALVEVKEVDNWQETIEENGWECTERLVNIPDNVPQFTCESNESNVNLITVTWINGNNEKDEMKNWFTAFQQENMTCTVDQTNPFWQ